MPGRGGAARRTARPAGPRPAAGVNRARLGPGAGLAPVVVAARPRPALPALLLVRVEATPAAHTPSLTSRITAALSVLGPAPRPALSH